MPGTWNNAWALACAKVILLLILSSVAIYIPSVSINLIQIEWVLYNPAFPQVGHILCLSGKLTLTAHQAVTAHRASYHLCKIAPFIYVAHLLIVPGICS